MAEAKTRPTKASAATFLAAIDNDTRRRDAETLLKVFKQATGWKPRMLGPSIVGFGLYDYTYESGHSGTTCVVGFSPRKAQLVDVDLAVLSKIIKSSVTQTRKTWPVTAT